MPVKMQNPCMREMTAEPRQAKVDAVELQHRSSWCAFDENLDITFHVRIPAVGIHEQIAAPDPVLSIKPAQFGQAVVFAPVIFDAPMRWVGRLAADCWIEPASFVEGLVVGSAAGKVAEEIPQDGGAAAKAGVDDNDVVRWQARAAAGLPKSL